MSEESNNNMKLQTAGELWPDSIKNLKLCNVFTHLLKEWQLDVSPLRQIAPGCFAPGRIPTFPAYSVKTQAP